jgi:hypothetical protein
MTLFLYDFYYVSYTFFYNKACNWSIGFLQIVNISKLYHLLGSNHSTFYMWSFQVSFPYKFLVLKMRILLFTKYMWKRLPSIAFQVWDVKPLGRGICFLYKTFLHFVSWWEGNISFNYREIEDINELCQCFTQESWHWEVEVHESYDFHVLMQQVCKENYSFLMVQAWI